MHFFDPLHRQIYEKAGQLIRLSKTADPRTLKSFLKENEKVGEITIAEYLARLAYEATTIINAEDYGRTIYDLSIRRNLITIGEDMVNIAYEAPVDMAPRDQIEDAERRLFELAEKGQFRSGFQGFAEALKAAIDMAGAAYQRERPPLRPRDGDGRPRQDDGRPAKLRPRHPRRPPRHGQVVARHQYRLQRRQGMARRTAGGRRDQDRRRWNRRLLFAGNVGRAARYPHSLRAGRCPFLRHPPWRDSRGQISTGSSKRRKRCSASRFYIDQTGGISIGQLAARARRLKRQRGLDFLIIDYLQLIQGTTRRSSESRVQEITEITTSLKALAKELNVPILALSQLSRQVESRDDKRPQLSDLRESGSIEQDADVVLFVFREEYYLKNRKPKEGTEEFFKWQAEMDQLGGLAEVIIGKQRHGPTGTVSHAVRGRADTLLHARQGGSPAGEV